MISLHAKLFLFNLIILLSFCFSSLKATNNDTLRDSEEVEILISTFLGNEKRNYYGEKAPESLKLIWKKYLGKGKTVISRKAGEREWAGAGWTGQPLLVRENGKLFLIQGAYNHTLRKIDAETGSTVWTYQFDDVVKGTGTIWENKHEDDPEKRYVIFQGSRLGTHHFLDAKIVPSFRAVSYMTGKELWRFNVKWTHSYSRDVDGSPLVIHDTLYAGLENSLFTVLNPDPDYARLSQGIIQPKVLEEHRLYELQDVKDHRNNVVTEGSPCLIKNKIIIPSGSGRIWGYNMKSRKLDWNFYIGSDIDGSAIATVDSCVMVSVEKQFIKGKGGVFKLDPFKMEKNAVEWYFPVDDALFNGWLGGVIGSVGISENIDQNLAAFIGIDGFLYVIDHKKFSGDMVLGPDSLELYPSPKLVFKKKIGPSISTPIFVDNKLIACGYNGIFLFKFDENNNFQLLEKKAMPFESTPIVYNNRIYVASRDGYLYCFGED